MKRPLADVMLTLERSGLHDVAVEASRQLDDPVDRTELEAFLQSFGVTREILSGLMGGSP